MEEEQPKTLETIWKGDLSAFRSSIMGEYRTLNIRYRLTVHGPIDKGAACSWLVANGYNIGLDIFYRSLEKKRPNRRHEAPITSLEELLLDYENRRIDILEKFRVGKITASELPGSRMRLFFEAGGYEGHNVYWEWAAELMNEMARLGFDREFAPGGKQGQALNIYYNERCETTPANVYDNIQSFLLATKREQGEGGPLWRLQIETEQLGNEAVRYYLAHRLFSGVGYIEVVPTNKTLASVAIYGYGHLNNFITGEEYQAGQTFLRALADSFIRIFGSGLASTTSTAVSPKLDISFDKGKPWEKIPDHAWDRVAIEMFCKGNKNSDIGKRVNVAPRTVTNRISFLRQQYPFIPTAEEVRKQMINRDTS